MPNNHPPLSAAQAAEETGIPLRTIQAALTRGALKAHKLPGATGSWVIERSDLDTWLAQRAAS